MPVCSALALVEPRDQPALRAWLSARSPSYEAGPCLGVRVAFVVEADSTEALTASLREVERRPGVLGVLAVYHAFDDEIPRASYGRRSQAPR